MLLDCKEIKPVHPKGNQSWIFMGRTDAGVETNILATWCNKLTHLKRPWYWEKLKAGGEGNDGEWDSWMASPAWWTWVWASSGSQWWTGKPGMLQSMGSQRVEHYWVTALNWTDWVAWWLSGKESACNAGEVGLFPKKDPQEKEMATDSIILAEKSHGQRSLAGYSPWGHKQLDRTVTEKQ